MGKKFELGSFLDRYPYLYAPRWNMEEDKKSEEKPRVTITIFPSTLELRRSLFKNPKFLYNIYRLLLPKECSFYILGYDPNFPPDTTSEAIAADFATFIREKIGPTVILATSYGGSVAIPFAALYPELTEKLILVSSTYGMEKLPDGTYGLADKILGYAKENKLFELERSIYCLSYHHSINVAAEKILKAEFDRIIAKSNPPQTMINAYEIIKRTPTDRKKYLPMIKAPTLILAGEYDQFFPQKYFKEAAELIPNCELKIIPEGTHIIFIENYRTCKKYIREFLGLNETKTLEKVSEITQKLQEKLKTSILKLFK